MYFTRCHLEFKKFRKRAEEIFLCAFSSKGAIVCEGLDLLDGAH